MIKTVRKSISTERTLIILATGALGLLSPGQASQAATLSPHNADDELLVMNYWICIARFPSALGLPTRTIAKSRMAAARTLDREEGWMPNVQASAS